MAFFPGLPMLLRAGTWLGLPVEITGVLLAAVGSAAAAAALLRLGGPWAAVAWLFAPTAVFTTVPYTEALFCAAAFWAWERARADRWLAAALLAAAACSIRVSGLFLVGALFVHDHHHRSRGSAGAGGAAEAAWLLLPLAVIGGLRPLPVRADRQLDGVVHRSGRRLGARVHPAVGRRSGTPGTPPSRGPFRSVRCGRPSSRPRSSRWASASWLPAGVSGGDSGPKPVGSASRWWPSPCRTGSSPSTGPSCCGSRSG